MSLTKDSYRSSLSAFFRPTNSILRIILPSYLEGWENTLCIMSTEAQMTPAAARTTSAFLIR